MNLICKIFGHRWSYFPDLCTQDGEVDYFCKRCEERRGGQYLKNIWEQYNMKESKLFKKFRKEYNKAQKELKIKIKKYEEIE